MRAANSPCHSTTGRALPSSSLSTDTSGMRLACDAVASSKRQIKKMCFMFGLGDKGVFVELGGWGVCLCSVWWL